MLVRQFIGGGEGPCSYLVGCERRRQAVLIHPDPSRLAPVERALDELRMRLVFVAETDQADGRELGRRGRFQSLIADLGLGDAQSAVTPLAPGAAIDLEQLPMVRPVRAWTHTDETPDANSEAPGLIVLQVGNRFVEIASPPRPDLEWFTAGGADEHPFSVTFGRARLQVGDLHVEIVPVPERPEQVAFRVGDRLFSGAPLLAGTGVSAEEGTAPSLLSLPPDTLVYPSRAVGGVAVGSVALERMRLDALVGGRSERIRPTTERRRIPDAAFRVLHSTSRGGRP